MPHYEVTVIADPDFQPNGVKPLVDWIRAQHLIDWADTKQRDLMGGFRQYTALAQGTPWKFETYREPIDIPNGLIVSYDWVHSEEEIRQNKWLSEQDQFYKCVNSGALGNTVDAIRACQLFVGNPGITAARG